MNPFLFIVGCPRSGTTLLQRLLDAHPELAVINETLWVTREAERRQSVTSTGLVTSQLIPRLFEHPRFRRLELDRRELEDLLDSRQPMSYARFVSAVFDLYGKRHGKPLVGDKSPGYVREIVALHSLWPKAKFVHLIRDGRDIWLSVAHWQKAERSVGQFATWVDDPISTTALWWERSVRLGQEAGASLGPELYYEIRYEALVADPADECAALCTFLGLPYEDTMLHFHEGKTKKLVPGLPSKRAWLPPTLGLRDWSSQMPPEHLERFEAAGGDLLDELGYPRATSRLPAHALEHAAAIRESFVVNARARRRSLPQRMRE